MKKLALVFAALVALTSSATLAQEKTDTDPATTVKCALGATCVEAPVTVKVQTPKKQLVKVDGTVPVTGNVGVKGKVTVEGEVGVKGSVVVTTEDGVSLPVEVVEPVQVFADDPLPIALPEEPIQVEVELPLYKEWWFWTAIGLVVSGAVVGGVCAGGYCGGTHHNEIMFR